jgi:hypothetical protein
MKRFASALVALLFVGVSPAALPQGEPEHAPDSRAGQRIAPLDFPPRPNAPFIAIADTLWVQNLPDGSTVTRKNERVVARDMDGRIFQERRTFIPVPDVGNQQTQPFMQVYSDPIAHTLYNCEVAARVCNLFAYNEPATQPLRPAGLQPDGLSFLARENLGTDTFEGLDVQRSRETLTLYRQSIGNTKTILRTVDYWYSPALGINVKVVRHDPRDGDQTLWLTDISESAGDPQYFKVPGGYRIIDHRAEGAQPVESQR